MALLLDAGALIGYDRRNLTVVAFIESAQRHQVPVRTTTGVVARCGATAAASTIVPTASRRQRG